MSQTRLNVHPYVRTSKVICSSVNCGAALDAKDELPHFRVRDLLLPLPLINLLLPVGILEEREEPLVYETFDFEADEEDVTLIGVVLLRGEEAATAFSDDSLIDNCILACCCGCCCCFVRVA